MKKLVFVASILLLPACVSVAKVPTASHVLPGETIVDKRLAKDALMQVALPNAMFKVGNGCKPTTYEVVNTKLTAPVQSSFSSTKWQETWSIKLCDQVVDLPINFETGLTGTTFSAPLN